MGAPSRAATDLAVLAQSVGERVDFRLDLRRLQLCLAPRSAAAAPHEHSQ